MINPEAQAPSPPSPGGHREREIAGEAKHAVGEWHADYTATPLCGGFGKYHSPNADRNPKALTTVTLAEIRAQLANPASVPKDQAPWCIFSTLLSRNHSEQRERGQFFALWAEVDDPGRLPFREWASRAGYVVQANALAYTTRSATAALQKARLIVPLADPVTGQEFVELQEVLFDKLTAAGLNPDEVTKRAGQICYLPNRGDFYDYVICTGKRRFDPARWRSDVDEIRARNQQAQAEQRKALEASNLRASERVASGCESPLDAFNAEFPLEVMLETFGYLRKGGRWLSPNSASRSAGVSITEDGRKWLSAHESDASIGRPTNGGTMGDAFDLFVYYKHGGDRDAALKEAGGMFTTSNGETITAANQRTYVKASERPPADVASLPNGQPAEWPELVTLAAPPPTPLPIAAWPSVLGSYATEAAAETETPPELAGLLALGVMATASQRLAEVAVKPDYTEPLNGYFVISLPPASRKTAEFSRAIKPLKRWEQQRRKDMAEEIRKAESLLATHVARVKRLRTSAAKAEGEEAANLAHQIAELEAQAPTVPRPPTLFTQDVTSEHLGTMMADNGEAMAILSDEGGLFQTMDGRYSKGVPNLDVYLQGHAGGAIRTHRQGRPAVVMDKPRLTMAMAVQPDVINGIAANPSFRGRGLLGRFLYALPPCPIGSRHGDGPRMNGLTEIAFANRVTELLDASADATSLQRITLTSEASRAWWRFWREIERELAQGGRFEHCRDWAGKLPGAVARIAALFHLADAGTKALDKPLELRWMEAAIETGRALATHALAFFGGVGADPDVEHARKILEWLQRNQLAEFTKREAHRAHQSRFKRAQELTPVLEVLRERGYIRSITGEQAAGRPSDSFEVNPEALTGEGFVTSVTSVNESVKSL